MTSSTSHRPNRSRSCLLPLAAGLAAALALGGAVHRACAAAPATDQSILVTRCDDSGPGTLRDALAGLGGISGAVVIDLSQLTCSAITLSTGALVDTSTTEQVTLVGPDGFVNGAPERLSGFVPALTIDGHLQQDRVLVHGGSGKLEIVALAISGGSYTAADTAYGGCIRAASDVELYKSTLSGCTATATAHNGKASGGGVYASGELSVFNSAVDGNTARADDGVASGGGGRAGSLVMIYSSVADNVATSTNFSRGGGLATDGDVYVGYSTISGNDAPGANSAANGGGGAYFNGAGATRPLSIANSTISGNSATAGGGVFTKYAMNVSNSTIATNHSIGDGAGLDVFGATDLQSSIVADNMNDAGDDADIAGPTTAVVSGANNLVIVSTLPLPPDTLQSEPLLAPLADNGGSTLTHALLPGSPAIDAGNNAGDFYDDQRSAVCVNGSVVDYERQAGAAPDIGAFEFGAPDRLFTDGFEIASSCSASP